MKYILEKRLESITEDDFTRLKDALKAEHIDPRENWRSMPYLKDELAAKIAKTLVPNVSREFSKVLYSAVNKEPLKRVYYGIRSIGKIPENFLNALTPWERTYFAAGRWEIRTPELREPIEVLTVRHLKAGLECLYRHHFVRKAKGEYTAQLELPEDDSVRGAYERVVSRYENEKMRNEVKQTPILQIEEPRGEEQLDLFH